jgi:OOP family OmpA-OmpF porin
MYQSSAKKIVLGVFLSSIVIPTMAEVGSNTTTTPFKPFQPFPQYNAKKPSMYVGASVGQANLHGDCNNACQDSDTAWKIYGGYRVMDQLTVQASYMDLGEFGKDNDRANIKGFSVSALAPFEINKQLSVFGKAGFFQWNSKTAQGHTLRDLDPMLGLGADYQFNNNLAIRGELDHYKDVSVSKDNGSSDLQIFSLGVNYSTL